MSTITTTVAAHRLGVTDSHVRRLALQMGLGRRVGARLLVFTEAEIRKMEARPLQPGRWPKG
jgi:hypothetical protein